MTALTLCMIVKDEEAFLGACLESVAGLVDSIVVVDTGSRDRTQAIARAQGATVVEHVWNDDFAAARNAALAHVPRTKDRFVLVLDADERLAPAAANAIRAALARNDLDLGMLPLHDACALEAKPRDVVEGRARRGEPVRLPRLLRFTDDLRWEGVVHEQVKTWALREGRRIRPVDAAIVHYGAVPSLRKDRAKDDRNRALLERRAQSEPHDPFVRAYLAREYERAGDGERAYEEARAAWGLIEASAKHSVPRGDVVLPATLMAYLSIRRGDLDAAENALQKARGWSSEHPNFELLEGLVHERRALVTKDEATLTRELCAARDAYDRCLAMRGRIYAAEIMPGACGTTSLTRLGSIYLLANEPRAALERFDAALREYADLPEAYFGRCEALILCGDVESALRSLGPVLKTDLPDAWALAALAAAALGQADDVRTFVQRARAAGRKTRWLAAWRRERLVDLERDVRTIPARVASSAESSQGASSTRATSNGAMTSASSRVGSSSPGVTRSQDAATDVAAASGATDAISATNSTSANATDAARATHANRAADATNGARVAANAAHDATDSNDLRASVIIPCYNRFDLLKPVLEGFAREARGTQFELVLVDDGSTTPVADLVRELGLETFARVVRRENGGRGAALNTGLEHVTGDVVIFCDSDIVPGEGFVAQHLDFHRRHPSELATHLGALEWGVDAGLFGALAGARSNPRLRLGETSVDWTRWFTDNWSFKRTLFASRGLRFDLAYRAWGFEELDLARELEALGATNTLTRRAKGSHLKPATVEGMLANFARSVPNLLHLATKAPLDADVHTWLSAHSDEASIAAAERAFTILWQRIVELDATHSSFVRDVRDTDVDELSTSLCDVLFRIGIARGLASNPELVARHRAVVPREDGARLLDDVERLARNVQTLERRIDGDRSTCAWLAPLAEALAWDASKLDVWLDRSSTTAAVA